MQKPFRDIYNSSGVALFLVITMALIIGILALGAMIYRYNEKIIIAKRENLSRAFYYACEFINEGIWIIKDGLKVGTGLDIIPHDEIPDTLYYKDYNIENGSGQLRLKRMQEGGVYYWEIISYCEINPNLLGQRVSSRKIKVDIYEDTGELKPDWQELQPPE